MAAASAAAAVPAVAAASAVAAVPAEAAVAAGLAAKTEGPNQGLLLVSVATGQGRGSLALLSDQLQIGLFCCSCYWCLGKSW